MCGLVVTVSFDGEPADPVLLARASTVLQHRGPDDWGLGLYGPVGFGFRRLAILDLSPAGHQPMESPDGRLAIVFNGEIYNYVELRAELEQRGRTFRSASDTEVLLQAYDEWGPDCVTRFNGMWAFVIYDRRARTLFVSRDRFGVKPLYRWSDGRRLVLASEIKAILATGWYQPSTNWEVAAKFLCRGHLDEDSQTFYAGINQVPAGSTLHVDLTGRTSERRFWSLSDVNGDPPEDPVGTFRDLFEDAVRLRMRSDVPVGVCLSGGIDSNAIISMMAALRGPEADYPLQAFSYIPTEFSEAEYINESIARTGALLNELRTTPQELWDLMPKALWHYDEPVHSANALIGFQLMRLARSKGVTVILNGQGADEVNAGYHDYFTWYWNDLLRAGRWRRAGREIAEYARGHDLPYSSLMAVAARSWLRTALAGLPGHAALRVARRRLSRYREEAPHAATWFDRELLRHLPPRDATIRTGSLGNVLAYGVERRPLPLYLRVEDRNSMAHSVEARLPFLDYRLVSLAFSLPNEWKLRGPWNKFLVREALKGVIAEPVRTRLDKMGFPTPSRRWFAGPWYEPALDLLGCRVLRDAGFCKVDTVRRDLELHRRGRRDMSRQLFHLAEFTTWLETARAARTVRTQLPRVSPAGGSDVTAMPVAPAALKD